MTEAINEDQRVVQYVEKARKEFIDAIRRAEAQNICVSIEIQQIGVSTLDKAGQHVTSIQCHYAKHIKPGGCE